MNHDSSVPSYKMYDVFNNAFTHGGKLNATLDRFFVIPKGSRGFLTESILQRKTKYGNRNQMSDITLRLGVVVSDDSTLNRIY